MKHIKLFENYFELLEEKSKIPKKYLTRKPKAKASKDKKKK